MKLGFWSIVIVMARDNSFFTQVKEQVPLEDYLIQHLNVDLVPDGPGRLAAVCPFHDEDTPSFKIQDSDEGFQYWRCYGACQTGGTVIDAVMKAEDFELPFEAAKFLNELYELELDQSFDDEAYRAFATTVAETREQIAKNQETMYKKDERLSKVAFKYLHNRGFTDETIEDFQLAVDDSYTKAGRLSIPIYDKTNHPISIASRALFDEARCQNCRAVITTKEIVKRKFQHKRAVEKAEDPETVPDWRRCPSCDAPPEKAKIHWLTGQNPKYRFPASFDKSHYLYNQFKAREHLKNDPDAAGLFLVEGYADAWAGYQSGHKAICSYNGAQLSAWQAEEAVSLAKKFAKPVILIPDFDETGHLNIEKNINRLRNAAEDIEIDIIHGVDTLKYKTPEGEKSCKDLGDVLQHFGEEQVTRVLDQNRWPAAEWQIRQIVEKRNSRTGAPFHSEIDQLRLVSGVLANNKSKVALDHLIQYLSANWERDFDTVHDWFYSEISDDSSTSYQHLFKDIHQSRDESRDFLKDDNVIPIGFEALDQCFPGNGARPGQLFMFLGKSGTGKAQPLYSKVLTASGWKNMGDIKLGETIINPEGGPASVVGVFPQGIRDIYRVTFSDGSHTDCDLEHLWQVENGKGEKSVKTLKELEELLKEDSYFIPLAKNIQVNQDRRHSIEDPYFIASFVAKSEEEKVFFKAGNSVSSYKNKAGIPNDLLESATLEERRELLKGFADSLAEIKPEGFIFKLSSKNIADNIVYLVRSLGGCATLNSDLEAYTVKCALPAHEQPFKNIDKQIEYAYSQPAARRIESIEYIGQEEAQCIALDSENKLYITDDFIVTHNTMIATQILANMAESGVRSVFFSLEQAAKALFSRLVCQALDVNMEEAEKLIRSDDPEDEKKLQPVKDIYKDMLIIDNVPNKNREAINMTPSRVQAIVQEANLTHFKDKPANVIVIDHLGILEVDDDAPADVKRSELMAPGFIMQRMFAVAKATNTLVIVLQQLPKEVAPGKAFGYDAGRGGSKQTDFCDAIFCIWRPEQDIELDEDQRAAVAGQYKLALGKNRYGSSAVAHLFFDKASLRIMPPLSMAQPDHINPDGPVIEIDEKPDALAAAAAESIQGQEVSEEPLFPNENPEDIKTEKELTMTGVVASGDINSGEALDKLSQETDPLPTDTQALLDSLGAKAFEDRADDKTEAPDPALKNWFD